MLITSDKIKEADTCLLTHEKWHRDQHHRRVWNKKVTGEKCDRYERVADEQSNGGGGYGC